MSHERANLKVNPGATLDEPSSRTVRRFEMFTSIRQKIARVVLVATITLIAAGVPVSQIIYAADCAGSGSGG